MFDDDILVYCKYITLLLSYLLYLLLFQQQHHFLIIKGTRQRDFYRWFFIKRLLRWLFAWLRIRGVSEYGTRFSVVFFSAGYCYFPYSLYFCVSFISSCRCSMVFSVFAFSKSNVSEYFETHFENHLLITSVSFSLSVNKTNKYNSKSNIYFASYYLSLSTNSMAPVSSLSQPF